MKKRKSKIIMLLIFQIPSWIILYFLPRNSHLLLNHTTTTVANAQKICITLFFLMCLFILLGIVYEIICGSKSFSKILNLIFPIPFYFVMLGLNQLVREPQTVEPHWIFSDDFVIDLWWLILISTILIYFTIMLRSYFLAVDFAVSSPKHIFLNPFWKILFFKKIQTSSIMAVFYWFLSIFQLALGGVFLTIYLISFNRSLSSLVYFNFIFIFTHFILSFIFGFVKFMKDITKRLWKETQRDVFY